MTDDAKVLLIVEDDEGLQRQLKWAYEGYEVICAGCGIPFQSNRRPLPGKKRWCDNCRKTGEPAADRARRYRQRKAEVT